jgi:cysteine-rich repeat protein
MRFICILFGLVTCASASVAQTTTLPVSIPTAAVPEARTLCEFERSEGPYDPALWTDPVCASHIFALGMYEVRERKSRREVKVITRDTVAEDLDDYKALHTLPLAASFCGDGVVNVFLDEACDDGNHDPDDGCEPDCTLP